jgi:hypothetical protein
MPSPRVEASPPGPAIPPTSELFDIHSIVERHPHLLTESRVRWALRNRTRNGLDAQHAVFMTASEILLIHEPAFLRWWLGLGGRNRPRRPRA